MDVSWMVFPPLFVVRVLLTCSLGKSTALRANEREREAWGALVAAQNFRSGFSSRLQPREFRIEIESYRFYMQGCEYPFPLPVSLLLYSLFFSYLPPNSLWLVSAFAACASGKHICQRDALHLIILGCKRRITFYCPMLTSDSQANYTVNEQTWTASRRSWRLVFCSGNGKKRVMCSWVPFCWCATVLCAMAFVDLTNLAFAHRNLL
jgi:hypothetical protein